MGREGRQWSAQRIWWGGAILGFVTLFLLGARWVGDRAGSGADWSAYGGGPDNTHFSPLRQIDRRNVGPARRGLDL